MFAAYEQVSFHKQSFIDFEIALDDYKMPLLLVFYTNLKHISLDSTHTSILNTNLWVGKRHKGRRTKSIMFIIYYFMFIKIWCSHIQLKAFQSANWVWECCTGQLNLGNKMIVHRKKLECDKKLTRKSCYHISCISRVYLNIMKYNTGQNKIPQILHYHIK